MFGLSEKGLSRHNIVPSGKDIDAYVYVQICIPRFIDIIKENHENDQIVFWPELAFSHYSNKALKYLSNKNIEVVPVNCNQAYWTELRFIEYFWSELKRMMYDKCWEANNLEQLWNRLDYAFKNVTHERIHNFASSTLRRING